MTDSPAKPIVLGVTGASGAIYARRLLHVLFDANCDIHLSISPSGKAVFEQELPNIAHRLMGLEPDANGSDFQRYLAILTQISPSFSLRGGTREILRGIIARGLGLR